MAPSWLWGWTLGERCMLGMGEAVWCAQLSLRQVTGSNEQGLACPHLALPMGLPSLRIRALRLPPQICRKAPCKQGELLVSAASRSCICLFMHTVTHCVPRGCGQQGRSQLLCKARRGVDSGHLLSVLRDNLSGLGPALFWVRTVPNAMGVWPRQGCLRNTDDQ